VKKSNAITPIGVPPARKLFPHRIVHASNPLGISNASGRTAAAIWCRVAASSGTPSRSRCARVRRSISPGSSTSAPAAIGGDALDPRRHARDLLAECLRAAKGIGVEYDRQHVVDEPVGGCVRRIGRQSARQGAREDLAEDGQSISLVGANGQQGSNRRDRRTSSGPDSAVPRCRWCSRRKRLASIHRDLDLAFGDRGGRDVEDQRHIARCAGGDGVGGEAPVLAAVGCYEDAETRRVHEVNRSEPRRRDLLGPCADASEVAGVANGDRTQAGPLRLVDAQRHRSRPITWP
jgi:hypothetical protein